MQKFKVYVEKKMYATGAVEVESTTPEEAINIVNEQIKLGKLTRFDVIWEDEGEYVANSFTATGDVDDIADKEDKIEDEEDNIEEDIYWDDRYNGDDDDDEHP